MTRLRLGTRQSALAEAQARWVADLLAAHNPGLVVELVPMTTSGDRSAERGQPLALPRAGGRSDGRGSPLPGGLKALFTKEIEEALLAKHIDLAVHSLKDMTAELPAGLTLAAVPRREDPRDAWISKRGVRFKDLPKGAAIATGAVRRQAQLRHHRPDLKLVAIRGNVDTRLRKLEENNWDGLVLAYAGLKRLGREKAAMETLAADVMVPAVGQGALGLEIRAGDSSLMEKVRPLNDELSSAAVHAERALLRGLGGSCQTPIAGYAEILGNKIRLTAVVAAPAGDPYLRAIQEGPLDAAEVIGMQLAKTLLARGADKILV